MLDVVGFETTAPALIADFILSASPNGLADDGFIRNDNDSA